MAMNRTWKVAAGVIALVAGVLLIWPSVRRHDPGVSLQAPGVAPGEVTADQSLSDVASAPGADTRLPVPQGVSELLARDRRVPGTAEGGTLVVRVADSEGVPVPGATVCTWSAPGLALRGETDSHGELVVRLGESRTMGVLVERVGFSSVRHYLGNSVPEELEVCLVQGWSLEGVARAAGSGEPLGGVTVVALLDGEPVDAELMRQAVSSFSVLPRATSGSDGLFKIEGLDRALRYHLHAIGDGCALPRPIPVDVGTPNPVPLEMWFLYGIELSCVDGAGNPLAISELVDLDSCTSWGVKELSKTESIGSYGATALLLKARGSGLEELGSYSVLRNWMFYASPVSKQRIGPIRFRKCVPGYSPVSTELWLHPIREEVIVKKIVMTARAESFGSLEIEFPGAPLELGVHTSTDPVRYVFLRYTESEEAMQFPLDISSERFLVGVIPTGDVQVAFARQSWYIPDWDTAIAGLSIGEGVNRLELDLNSWGGVEADLVAVGGVLATGPASIELVDGQTNKVIASYRFAHAPYRIYGIERGSYSLVVGRGYGPGVSRARSGTFHVLPGSVAKVRCLPE